MRNNHKVQIMTLSLIIALLLTACIPPLAFQATVTSIDYRIKVFRLASDEPYIRITFDNGMIIESEVDTYYWNALKNRHALFEIGKKYYVVYYRRASVPVQEAELRK